MADLQGTLCVPALYPYTEECRGWPQRGQARICWQVQAGCWGCLRRLHPGDRIEGTCRARNQNPKAKVVNKEYQTKERAKEDEAGLTACG